MARLKILFLIIAAVILAGCSGEASTIFHPTKNEEKFTSAAPAITDTNEEETTSAAVGTTATRKEEITSAAVVSTPGESPELEKEDWALFLINEEFPLPDDYSIKTKPIYKQRELDSRCADFAIQMLDAAKKDGIELEVTSAYRSVEKQKENIENYIENYMDQGFTKEQAEEFTYNEVAKPGCSEHNAGLAMDIVTTDWFMDHTELTADFENTREFKWLRDHSWEYGFIMSYPSGKEDITGFAYEPWHYRYVGQKYAKEIYDYDITLNEYIEQYVS